MDEYNRLHSFSQLLGEIKDIKIHFLTHCESKEFNRPLQDFDDIIMAKIELKNTIAVLEKLLVLWSLNNNS